jgi:hypothetical protein
MLITEEVTAGDILPAKEAVSMIEHVHGELLILTTSRHSPLDSEFAIHTLSGCALGAFR